MGCQTCAPNPHSFPAPAQSRYFRRGHDSRRLSLGFRQTKIVKSLSSGKAYCEWTLAVGRTSLNNSLSSALRCRRGPRLVDLNGLKQTSSLS